MKRLAAALLGLVGSNVLSCTPSRTEPGADGDMSTPPDVRCGPEQPCPAGRRCYKEACVPDLGPCCSDDDCQNDSRCDPQPGGSGPGCGFCVPWGTGEFDPLCQGERFAATEFKPPAERCRWPLPGQSPMNRYVMSTPLVIDLDGDAQPEIVFAAQRDNGATAASLVAIHGKDCTQLYEAPASIQPYAQIAAADLDGDRRPEIIALDFGGGSGKLVNVFDGRTGALLGGSSEAYQVTIGGYNCSGPAIADLDGDGAPEVVIAGMALRWDRALRKLVKIWSQPATGSVYGALSSVADMDGDGKPDVVSGNRIFDGLTGADETPAALKAVSGGYYTAIADFNKDGFPDVVLVNRGALQIIDVHNNRPLLNLSLDVGGPPTVADFDGDGTPDVGSAGVAAYVVASIDCAAMPRPGKCKGPGILWQSRIKDASGSTASSVFDFNGDGKAEVVYRDECWLRVYNGEDGKVVFAAAATSATGLEMPVVADVDSDGHADLLVPSDKFLSPTYCATESPEPETKTPHGGQTEGLVILRDPMNRWMPSRPLWNQHTYHITNINDDGTVPAREMPNWTSYNNYRQNVQGKVGMSGMVGDVTSRESGEAEQGDCVTEWRLAAQICNRGSAPVPAEVAGTFYRMDPRGGGVMPICTGRTMMALAPGGCEPVRCTWRDPPKDAVDLWFRAGDDGTGGRISPQCKSGNDLAHLPGARCAIIPG